MSDSLLDGSVIVYDCSVTSSSRFSSIVVSTVLSPIDVEVHPNNVVGSPFGVVIASTVSVGSTLLQDLLLRLGNGFLVFVSSFFGLASSVFIFQAMAAKAGRVGLLPADIDQKCFARL